MDKKEEFLKNIKPRKWGLLIAAVFLLSVVASLGVAYKAAKDEVDKETPLKEVQDEDIYACIDAEFAFGPIAETTGSTGEKVNAYIIIDDETAYIAGITENLEDKLKDVISYTYTAEDDEVEKPESVKLCGMSRGITTDLKDLTIEGYNTILDTEILNSSNFDQVFGYYYIDSTKSPYDSLYAECGVLVVFGIIGLVILAVYIFQTISTNKTLKKYENQMDKIALDIASPDTIYDKKARVYFTKDYIVDFASGFKVYEYKDIVWIYPHEMRQNGYVTQKSIYVVTSDSKAHVIANLSASKKNRATADELYQSLVIKMPNVLHGYTEENKRKAKELYKK